MESFLNQSYDIVVVGAGPAGSIAAKTAALNGSKVLMVDRKEKIGMPIQCAGFIPDSSELEKLIPSMRLPDEAVNIPKDTVLQKVKNQRIYTADLSKKEFPVKGYVVDRFLYDTVLAENAADAGVNVCTGTKAVSFSSIDKKDGTTVKLKKNGKTYEVKTKVVIGADGPVSLVARTIPGFLNYHKNKENKNRMFSNVPYERGLGYGYKMTNTDNDTETIEMFFGNEFVPGGYVWIFPEGENRVNVGIGVRRSLMKDIKEPISAKTYLDTFIKTHPIGSKKLAFGKIESIISGIIPVDGAPEKTVRKNFLIVGDAAGHITATNGGGVPFAMAGALIAGNVAADFISGKEKSLENYEVLWKKSFGSAIDSSVQARIMADKIMGNDKFMSSVIKLTPASQLKKMQCGKIPSTLNYVIKKFI